MADSKRARRRREGLRAERDFLIASLKDLETEHLAGDIADDDYATLRADYLEREERVARALEAEERGGGEEHAPELSGWVRLRRRLGCRGARRYLLAGLALCVAGALSIVALSLAGVRLPGQSATGTVNLPANETIADELSAASEYGDDGELTDAISLYDAVLGRDPKNPEALTNRAWLFRLVGIAGSATDEVRTGDEELAQVVAIAPGYAPARAFYGLAELQDRHAPEQAIVQFRAFLSDKPSVALRDSLAPEIEKAFSESHATLPPALRAELGAATSSPSGA